MNKMKPERKCCRKIRAQELKRTHYTLGNDQGDYLSQYRHDYPPKPFDDQMGPNMDSVTLRQSHFKLGDYQIPYDTSSMEMSKTLLGQGSLPATLDENVKADLRRSHFVFGNNEPNYQTTFRKEYPEKNSKLENVDFKEIERRLRATSHVLGDDKPDYISETAAKYTKPELSKDMYGPRKTISTAELQQSHYVFGTNNVQWATNYRMDYVPKKVDQALVTKNLTKTNFVLGDDEPTLKSVNQETFIRHPIVKNGMNKELAEDLRRHHFNFGNENPDLTTSHIQDYQDPKKKGMIETALPKIDPQFLRDSHWTLGDSAPLQDQYNTTYGIAMTPKKQDRNPPAPNSTFNSSFKITGNGPTIYQTEFRENYIPLNNRIDPKELKIMQGVVKDIKSSHFDLGEMKNDYGTTTGNSYKFDPIAAKGARGNLDRELINDLRATHYKLGYLPFNGVTTHRITYVPKKGDFKLAKDPALRQSHFELGVTNNAIQDGKTIYMTDYVEKEIPIDNNC